MEEVEAGIMVSFHSEGLLSSSSGRTGLESTI